MARPELLEKRPGWGGGKWNATTVLLEPLNGEETDRLVDALGGVSQEMRERIRLAAEGNPLFVEEMLALLQESGGHDVVVPPTIQALLAARLDQLQPDERSVLEAGSVEGRVFHRSAVQVLSQEQGSLQGKLLGLVRKELVRPERAQLRGDEAYRFRHLLIRDAAYEALPKATRAELHERFAGWLEERGTGLIELDEIVGYHLEQAARYRSELGQPEQELAARAGERLARAGRQALWRGDKHSASTLLERALQLLRPIRWDTYLEIDLVDSLNLHAGEALSRMEEIARHAEAAGDDCGAAVARVMCVLWREFVSNEISVNDFEAETRATIALLERSGDHDGLIRAWDVLGFSVYNGALQYEGWAHATEQMIAHARAIGKPGVYTLPVAIANGPRPADDALATLDQLLREEPHPDVLAWHAALLAMLGRFDEARQEGSTAYQRAWELGAYPVRSLWALTQVEVFAGDYEAAAGHLGQMCESLEHQGNVNILSTFIGWLGRSLATLGRFDEAEDCARRGRELGIEEDLITQALWRQVLARVLAHRGEHPEAERLVREAIDLLEQADTLNIKGDAFCDLAEVLETAGKREEAIAALTQALALYQQKKNVAMVAQVKSRLDALAERDAEAPR
jgi:tetratricopeptide (TPR) repeat protein